MTLGKEQYPRKILDKEFGYVYLMRLDAGDKFAYKIGYSRNLKARVSSVKAKWGSDVDLLAYGCCRNVEDVEFELHKAFYEKYHFSILYELFYPMWSTEYFKFDYDGIVAVIRLMNEKCNCTIISRHFKDDAYAMPVGANGVLV